LALANHFSIDMIGAQRWRAEKGSFCDECQTESPGRTWGRKSMIGIVLVTHGQLAEEFRHAVEHVVGPQDNFGTVAIGAEDDMEQRRRDIVEAVSTADTGSGVIIVTDMFGGTPSNLAISVMDAGRVEVIAGMNLPMLIKLSSARMGDDMASAVEEAQEAGRKYINVASRLLSAK
jgi:PTS system mannose-specific IIA component